MDYNTFLTQLKNLVEQTTRYTPPQARRDYMDNYDRYVDFPYIEDPKGYTTHRAIEQKDEEVEEQSGSSHPPGEAPAPRKDIATEQEKAIDPEGAGKEAGATTNDPTPATGNPANPDPAEMGTDPMAAGAMGMGGMMMGQQEEELTSSQIGRVYELKKIYSRLSSVETYLSRATDESILELRKYVAQSINLFEVVISNYAQFKDKIDEIIINYYKFLDVVYESLRKYYKDIQNVRVDRSK